jgi:capsular polysaccharide transport system ATP-binding protein
MLVVRGLTKRFHRDGKTRTLFENLSFDLPRSGRLGLLGRNGQGKSTLIKILGGVVWPSSGVTSWSMSASWPLGFDGGFQGAMSGYDNIKFIARIYRRDFDSIIGRVDEFAELGDSLMMPIKYFSSGMRARLSFGISLAFEFDCYLIDEVIAVGDALFREKCDHELFEKREDRAFVIASHDVELIRRICDRAIVIDSGRAKLFNDIDKAIGAYAGLCAEEAVARQAIKLS